MIESLKKTKWIILFISIISGFLFYAITIFSLNNFIYFDLQNGLLSFFILTLTPYLTFKLLQKKELFSVINYLFLGAIIAALSSFLRVYILDEFLTRFIYNIVLSNSSEPVEYVFSYSERFNEFIKFTFLGILFFGIAIIFKKIISLK